MKGSNLTCSLGLSQNKGLTEHQRRASQRHASPSPSIGREAGMQQPEQEGKGQSQPQRSAFSTKLWAGSQLLTMSSWDTGQLSSARRVAAWDQLPRGDTWHTWDGALLAHPGNWVVGTRGLIKMHSPPGTVHSPSTWSLELLESRKGTKHKPKTRWLHRWMLPKI